MGADRGGIFQACNSIGAGGGLRVFSISLILHRKKEAAGPVPALLPSGMVAQSRTAAAGAVEASSGTPSLKEFGHATCLRGHLTCISVQLGITTKDPGLAEWYTPFARQVGFQAWPFRNRLVQSHHARKLRQFPLGSKRKRETQPLDQLKQREIGIGDGVATR